jgi:hypothetical protein
VESNSLKRNDTLIEPKSSKMNLYFQNYSNSILPSYLYEVSAQVYHPNICFSFDPMLVKHSSDMPKNSILLVIFDINDISTWEEAKSFVEDNP